MEIINYSEDEIISYVNGIGPKWVRQLIYSKNTTDINIKQSIIYLTSNLSFKSTPDLQQRYWHIKNNSYTIPICIICDVNNCNWDANTKEYRKTCSISCAMKDINAIDKRKASILSKYGPDANKIMYEKYKNTSLVKYGTNNASQSESAKNKRKATIKSKYGVEFLLQNKDLCDKAKRTKINRYGEEYGRHHDILDKSKKTNNERYGVDWIIMRDDVRAQNKKQLEFKYGSGGPLNNIDIRNKITKTIFCNNNGKYHFQSHIPEESLVKLEDSAWLFDNHVTQKKTLECIASELNVSDVTIGNYLRKHGINILKHSVSMAELEIRQLLIDYDIIFTTNNRSLISNELDLVIPDKNIAIEFNGLYWHSDIFKSSKYHINKYNECAAVGIKLITIFEDEWNDNKQLVKNTILNKLNKTTLKKIYARKCTIKPVNTKDKIEFFNSNHIQGDGPSSINFGLYNNDKLVACIGFIKGKEYTLNRYATSCNVVGGFSKLLAHFERLYNNPPIITFADLRWSDGDLYKKTGFKQLNIINEDYYWVYGNKRYHKFSFRHKQMKKKLKNYDPNLSESENMYNHGFNKIWDCGKIKFIKNQ